MMHRLALVLVAFCQAGPAMAQRLSVHGTIGRASSDMNWEAGNGEVSSANQTRESVYAAVGVRRRVARWFSLATDVQLVGKGYDRTAPTLHATFIEVPLLLLWEGSGPARRTQPYLGGGLAPGVRLRCRRFFIGNIGPHEDGCGAARYSALALEPYRRWDVSQEWRAGVRRALGAGRLVAGLRASASLTDQQPGRESRNVSTHHFVLGWGLGYELPVR